MRADVGIRGGRIAAIGDLRSSGGDAPHRCGRADGRPGFIDMHNHSDYTILVEPKSESMIRQGVTTMVLGESRSAGPIKAGSDEARARADGVTVDWTTLGGYFAKLEQQHMSTNIASYVGEEQVWTYVKGYGQSPATPAELEAMKRLIAQAMEDGAMGLSTALLQPPSSFATTADLIELAKTAKQYGGIYSSHIRDEGEGVFRADRRSDPGRQGRGDSGRHHPHEDRAQEALGPRERDHRDGAEGARRRATTSARTSIPTPPGRTTCRRSCRRGRTTAAARRCSSGSKDPAARKRMRDEVMNGLPNWYNHYLATGDGWGGMILVSLRHERNRAVPGQAHERVDRGARRPSRRCAVRRADRGERQRPDGLLPSLRSRTCS